MMTVVSILEVDASRRWICDLNESQHNAAVDLLMAARDAHLIEDFVINELDSTAEAEDLFRSLADLLSTQTDEPS